MAYVEGVGEVPEEVIAPQPPATPAPEKPSFLQWLGSPEAMAFASGLLKASGPSPIKVGMGQALGMGMEEMLKAKLQFGNQQLDKDKFGYQKEQDAKQLALQRDKFGLDKEQHALQKQLQGAHKALYEAQTQEALQKINRQKQLADFINQLSPMGGSPFKPNSAPTPPQPSGTPEQSQSPIPSQNPPALAPQQSGMLNAPQVAPEQSQAPGMLNNPPPAKPSLNDVMLKASILDGDFRSAGQIYKNMNDWDTQQGVDPQGNGFYFQTNKMTGQVRPVPGIQPPGTSATLEYQKNLNQEEAKNDADMRKRLVELTPILDNFNNIRSMLEKGTQTGAGFDQIVALQNLANTFNLDIEKDKLNDKQYLKNQIESAFNKYQTATRVPGVGSQSDREFVALRDQFLRTDLTPQTLGNVMKAFENNIQIKQRYIDMKGQWASTFGSPLSKDPKTGRTFNDSWRLYEKQIYGAKK
jgi:hypothetical protein